jgi:hypothetical protein
MNKLPPDAQALLDAAKHADDPTIAERVRSDAALRRTLAHYGVHGLPPLRPEVSESPVMRSAPTAPARAAFALKVSAGAIVVAAAAYFGLRATSQTVPQSPRAQASTAGAPSRDIPTPNGENATRATPAVAVPAPVVLEVSHPAPLPSPSHLERHPHSPLTRRPATRRVLAIEDDGLESELRTVAAVNELLRRQRFADALRLIERTDTEAASVLREERTALRIVARCGLAADERALREREQFLRSSPRSILADRVRNACGGSVGEKP